MTISNHVNIVPRIGAAASSVMSTPKITPPAKASPPDPALRYDPATLYRRDPKELTDARIVFIGLNSLQSPVSTAPP